MTRHLHSAEGSSWAVGRAWAALRQHFRAGMQDLPATGRGTWWRTVALGAVGLFALMVLLRLGAELALDAGWLDGERRLIARLGGPAGFLGLSDAVFVQTFGSDITLIILVLATATGAVLARRPLAALGILAALIGTDLVVRFGWLIWDRARPDLLYDGIASPGFHSFPSGHAAKSAAIYGLLAIIWRGSSGSGLERSSAALLALAIPLLTGAGRIAMGVHWPSDVAGGLLLGFYWALLLGVAESRSRRGRHANA